MQADFRVHWGMLLAVTSVIVLVLTGCQEASMRSLEGRDKQMKNYKNRKILKPTKPVQKPNPNLKRRTTPSTSSGSELRSRPVPVSDPGQDLERAFVASRGTALMTGKPEEVAIRRVTAAVKASLEVGPTVVIWLIDRTPSATKLTSDGVLAAKSLYDDADVRRAAAAGTLLSSIAVFDDQVEFIAAPPLTDWQKVRDAFDQIKRTESGQETPFAALQQALDKYLTLRTKDRHEMLFVVLTDEAGNDRDQVDAIVEVTKKNAIPVYVLGTPAPWGQTNPYLEMGKQSEKTDGKHDDTFPTHGPESLRSERVDIQMWVSNFGSREALNQIDSGFGPFALERLARTSGGEFFCIRPPAGATYLYGTQAMGHKFWPTGSELRFDPKVVGKYAPDYVSQDDYEQLLANNAARRSLVEAAQLEPINITTMPEQRFEKRNEAQMSRQLNSAQQFAARHSPPVDKLYGILSGGEGDREKLSSPRLQAEFDLAIGRALAAKVRLDGYNSMLAALKRGKNFTNESSREWLLEQGTMIETGSQIQKMADKAIMYLQRVVNDHPGTPWARLAEEELKIPLGWTWRES